MRSRVNRRPGTTIAIHVEGRPVQVEAELIGQWAVHATWGGASGCYTVSYIRDGHPLSGLTMGDVENAGLARGAAVRLAEILDGKLGTEPLDLDKHRSMLKIEIARICGGQSR